MTPRSSIGNIERYLIHCRSFPIRRLIPLSTPWGPRLTTHSAPLRTVQEVTVTPVAEPEHVERLLESMSSVSNDSHIFAEDAQYKTLTLDGGAVKFKLDTGADVSVITEETCRQLNLRSHLKAVQTKLMTPSGPLLPSGQFIARSGDTHFRVIVASTAAENLLDRTTTVQMGFIKRVAEISLADIGVVASDCMKIVIRDDAQPYSVVTPRRTPIPMEAAV